MRPSLLTIIACAAALTACGGGDEEPAGTGTKAKTPTRAADCVELWNSPANKPTRDVLRIVLTYAEPPAVSVDFDGGCNVIAVWKDSKRVYHFPQGEGPRGAPYETERKVAIDSLPPELRKGKLRFSGDDDPLLSRPG